MGFIDSFNKFKQTIIRKIIKPKYDLDTLEGINSIPVKSFKYDPLDGVKYAYYDIEYVLQRKATQHKKNGRMDLAIACLEKSNQIMPLSNMMYSPDDYLRLAKYLRLEKRFDEAREVEKKYNSSSYHSNLSESAMTSQLNRAKSAGTDLIYVVCNCFHCANCGIYGNRVYSISGNDKRFLKLPEYVLNNHKHCEMSFYPFMYGINYITDPYTGKSIDSNKVIEYSNRPLVDIRPQHWIDGYNHLQENNHQKEIDEINRNQARLEYEKIVTNLPDIAPKTEGGYLRMKKSESKNYQKIVSQARKKGIEIKPLVK